MYQQASLAPAAHGRAQCRPDQTRSCRPHWERGEHHFTREGGPVASPSSCKLLITLQNLAVPQSNPALSNKTVSAYVALRNHSIFCPGPGCFGPRLQFDQKPAVVPLLHPSGKRETRPPQWTHIFRTVIHERQKRKGRKEKKKEGKKGSSRKSKRRHRMVLVR